MKEYWTNEILQEGKVVWKVVLDYEPEMFVVYRNGKFGFFSTDWVSQGYLSGKCNPIGDPFGYDAAYVCSINQNLAIEDGTTGGYLALRRNGRWIMYAIDYGRVTLVIKDEPSIESIFKIVHERTWVGMYWRNLLEDVKMSRKEMDHTPDLISKLEPYQIFVFGSNLEGQHIGGAAKVAYEKFGAKWGQGVGLQGQSYAIPTMNLPLGKIKDYICEFISFANCHQEYQFLVTRIGCGIAGFKDRDIAPLFYDAKHQRNIILPKSFDDVIEKMP